MQYYEIIKPPIEAFQWIGTNWQNVYDWINKRKKIINVISKRDIHCFSCESCGGWIYNHPGEIAFDITFEDKHELCIKGEGIWIIWNGAFIIHTDNYFKEHFAVAQKKGNNGHFSK